MQRPIKDLLQSAMDGSEDSREELELKLLSKLKGVSKCATFYMQLGRTGLEDAVQECWLAKRTYWRYADQGRTDGEFYAWLGAICVNAMRSYCKGEWRWRNAKDGFAEYMESLSDEDEYRLDKYELLHLAVDCLETDEQDLLRRRFWARQTLDNIALELDLIGGIVVHNRLVSLFHRTRPVLEQMMPKECWL